MIGPITGTPEHQRMLEIIRSHGLDPSRMPVGGDDAHGYDYIVWSPADLLPGESATFTGGAYATVRRPWPSPEAGREIRQAWVDCMLASQKRRAPAALSPEERAELRKRAEWVVEHSPDPENDRMPVSPLVVLALLDLAGVGRVEPQDELCPWWGDQCTTTKAEHEAGGAAAPHRLNRAKYERWEPEQAIGARRG